MLEMPYFPRPLADAAIDNTEDARCSEQKREQTLCPRKHG